MIYNKIYQYSLFYYYRKKMNEYEKELLDEKFDTICNQMIRLHEENLELKNRIEELENKVERRWQAQQKARQKIFKMAEMISGQFLKSFNIQLPLLNFSKNNNNLLVEDTFKNINDMNINFSNNNNNKNIDF